MSSQGLKCVHYLVIIIAFFHKLVTTAAITCGDDGWILFEDSKCLRFHDNFETKLVAEQTCASFSTDPLNIPHLVSIKSKPEQDFLNTWIFKDLEVLNRVWLNGDRFNETNFLWGNGDDICFTNWDVGFPTNKSAENVCMEMSPLAGRQGKMEASGDGKWKDCRCTKRNLVVCEKKPVLTVPELQDILFKLRAVVVKQGKTIAQLTTNLTRTTGTVTELTNNLTRLTSSTTQVANTVTQLRNNPVPKGFIYVQLPSHPAPQTLWPNVQWRNVSPTYAGLFFRAEGGTAAGFGTLQHESCNRLINVGFGWMRSAPHQTSVPASGWSGWVMTGEDPRSWQNADGMRFQKSGAETRPKNKAVRIWERI